MLDSECCFQDGSGGGAFFFLLAPTLVHLNFKVFFIGPAWRILIFSETMHWSLPKLLDTADYIALLFLRLQIKVYYKLFFFFFFLFRFNLTAEHFNHTVAQPLDSYKKLRKTYHFNKRGLILQVRITWNLLVTISMPTALTCT